MSSSRAPLLLLLVCLLSVPACASRAGGPPLSASTPTSSISPAARLRHDLATVFTGTPADRVLWGIQIATPDGEVVYEQNPHGLLMPASNMKILTLAAAAQQLGWDYTFETTVQATTPLDPDGTIRGDLVVRGNGDPTISRQSGGGETLASWADLLWSAGVRRVEGRVIGDGTPLPGDRFGQAWQWDDLTFGYAAPVSGLIYNENTAEIVIGPGPSEGAAASVTLVDSASGLSIDSAVRTTSSPTPSRLSLRRTPGEQQVYLAGEVALDSRRLSSFVAVDDPGRYFARAFRDALVARGIAVTGPGTTIESDPPGPVAPGAPVFVRHRSMPLRDLAKRLMKISQNLYAEVLFRTLGGGEATDPRARETMSEVIGQWVEGPQEFVISDGSGLSRFNLTSAATLTRVLLAMFREPKDREPWMAALPVAGKDGTLERRMKGTPAEGRVHAKTGTIRYARALSGYAETKDGDWLVFSIIANNFAGAVTAADVDRLTEQAVSILASFSRNESR